MVLAAYLQAQTPGRSTAAASSRPTEPAGTDPASVQQTCSAIASAVTTSGRRRVSRARRRRPQNIRRPFPISEKVGHRARNAAMPLGRPRPTRRPTTHSELARRGADRAAASNPNPGVAAAASAQPHRVHAARNLRRSRIFRARWRSTCCCRPTTRATVRQHRRRAGTSPPDRALPVGGAEDQPARHRRCVDAVDRRYLRESLRSYRRRTASTGCHTARAAASGSSGSSRLDGEYTFRDDPGRRALHGPPAISSCCSTASASRCSPSTGAAGPRPRQWRTGARVRHAGVHRQAPPDSGSSGSFQPAITPSSATFVKKTSAAVEDSASVQPIRPGRRACAADAGERHDHRPVRGSRPGRHAEPAADLQPASPGAAAARPAAGIGLRDGDPSRRWPKRAYPPAGRRRGSADAAAVLRAGRAEGGFEGGIEPRSNGCSSARISCSASNGARGPAPRRRLPHQRSRAGVAPVVLPVEQHSRRRVARRRGARHA